MKKLLAILSLLLCLGTSKVYASHAAGAELLYEYVSGTTWKFTMKFYRDCSGINEPNSFCMGIANTCAGTTFTITLNKVASTTSNPNGGIVNTGCDSSYTNCAGGTLPGFREWVYEGTASLPAQCTLWRFWAVEVARNPQYNITGGNLYVEATLDNLNAPNASSPYFTFKPVPYLCVNQGTTYNNGAIDPNGDSLSFESITPQTGNGCNTLGATNCGINTGNMPTYNPVTNPVPVVPGAFNLSQTTGLITLTPNVVSNNVLTVVVKKWRNGILVGTVRRDIQVAIVNCPVAIPSSALSSTSSGLNLNATTGFYDACVNEPLNFCINIYGLPDTSNIKVVTNAAIALPGSSVVYIGYGTDTVNVCVSWFPGLTDTGLHNITILYNDTNCTYNLVSSPISFTLPIYVTPTTFALSDTTICAGESAQLKAIGGSAFVWQALPGGSGNGSLSCLNCSNPLASPTVTTSYQVISNLSSFCGDNIDTVTVTVGAVPVITAGTDTNLCRNSIYVIDASTNSIGNQVVSWSPATYLSATNILNPTIANPQNSISYTLTVTDGATPCAAKDTVNFYVLTPLNIFNNDTAICKGASVNIVAAGDPLYTYQWSPTTFVSNSTTKNASLTPDSSMAFTLTSSYFTCADVSETINVAVQNIPTVNAGPDRKICLGDTIHLLGTVAPTISSPANFYTFAWAPTGDLDNPAVIDPVFDGTSTTTLTLTITTPIGCLGTDNMIAEVVSTDFLNPIQSPSICPGNSVNYTAGGAVSYLWQPGHGVSDSTAANVTISPEASTVYTLYGTDVNGCKDTLYSNIYVAQNAMLNYGPDVTLFSGEVHQASPNTNCMTFSWAPSIGLSATNIANPSIQPSISTQYIISGVTEFGCTVVDTFIVNIDPNSVINAPNAFSPRLGGGANSTFHLDRRGIATLNSFKIFNRWGNLVYESTNINEGWDGNFNGQPQPMGTYVYMVDAIGSNGKRFTKTSNVTLLR
jgi:gliding motility-associated-like protein